MSRTRVTRFPVGSRPRPVWAGPMAQRHEVPRGQPLPADVVEPDRHAQGGQRCEDVVRRGKLVLWLGGHDSWLLACQSRAVLSRVRLDRAAATTRSDVNPNSLYSVAAAAEAPRCSRLTHSPASPTNARQPIAMPASTLTRARTPGGSTSSW